MKTDQYEDKFPIIVLSNKKQLLLFGYTGLK